jgi:hypothetical protein
MFFSSDLNLHKNLFNFIERNSVLWNHGGGDPDQDIIDPFLMYQTNSQNKSWIKNHLQLDLWKILV